MQDTIPKEAQAFKNTSTMQTVSTVLLFAGAFGYAARKFNRVGFMSVALIGAVAGYAIDAQIQKAIKTLVDAKIKEDFEKINSNIKTSI